MGEVISIVKLNVKGQSHSRSRTNHSQITHRLGLCVFVRREIDQFFRVSGVEITDESRMNRARITYNHRRITDISRTSTHTSKYLRCSIPRKFDARPTHESLTERVQTRTIRERSTYKHFRSAHVDARPTHACQFCPWMSVTLE